MNRDTKVKTLAFSSFFFSSRGGGYANREAFAFERNSILGIWERQIVITRDQKPATNGRMKTDGQILVEGDDASRLECEREEVREGVPVPILEEHEHSHHSTEIRISRAEKNQISTIGVHRNGQEL